MPVPRELGQRGSDWECLRIPWWQFWVTEAGLRGDSGLFQCQKVLKKADPQGAKELSCKGRVSRYGAGGLSQRKLHLFKP